ncbi:MAG TPA: nucleotidyl transferase AbiEii/AbiGii toxin family protein [Phycisphaerae bacterium]|nr:nucleotidyl transferase AbiEii/AbiGii toxin family protein [Phycisphaerae bacterium]
MSAEELMLAVARALDAAGIAFMLVGAFSASFHGIARSTEDADFVLRVDDLNVGALSRSLGATFRLDPQVKLETFTMGSYYTIRHLDSDFSVDLFLLKEDPHDQASFSRRVLVSYGAGNVYVSSPEDLVVTKLRWSQGGRRAKDISDARGVLAVQTPAQLDVAYMRRWADAHGTRELLETLLAETPAI